MRLSTDVLLRAVRAAVRVENAYCDGGELYDSYVRINSLFSEFSIVLRTRRVRVGIIVQGEREDVDGTLDDAVELFPYHLNHVVRAVSPVLSGGTVSVSYREDAFIVKSEEGIVSVFARPYTELYMKTAVPMRSPDIITNRVSDLQRGPAPEAVVMARKAVRGLRAETVRVWNLAREDVVEATCKDGIRLIVREVH